MGRFWADVLENSREMKAALKAHREVASRPMDFRELEARTEHHRQAGAGLRARVLAMHDLIEAARQQKTADALKGLGSENQIALAHVQVGALEPVKPTSALLQPGETAYATVRAKLYSMKSVGYRAARQSASVRLMKGFTLGLAGIRAAPVKAPVELASGELVVTDKRIVFAGDRKSFSIPFSKLVNYHKVADGFLISSETTTHNLETGKSHQTDVFGAVLDRLLRG